MTREGIAEATVSVARASRIKQATRMQLQRTLSFGIRCSNFADASTIVNA